MSMPTQHLAPVAYLRHLFGSYGQVAKAAEVERTAPSMWAKRGVVPTGRMETLLQAAAKQGLDLTANDLIRGRDIEIAAPAAPAVTEAGNEG